MDMAINDTSRPSSNSSQSFSQPSRLCKACSSVLEGQDLESEGLYPHHSSLVAFIEAANGGCYHCSQLFSSLGIVYQESLRLIAAGKAPDKESWEVIEKRRTSIGDITEFIEIYADPVERDTRFRDVYGQPSFVSFTMMRLIHDWRSQGDAREGIKAGFWKIEVELNPMYEAYLPPHLGAYHGLIKRLWKSVRIDLQTPPYPHWIIPQKAFREIGFLEELSTNTGSKATWTTIDGWLRECSEQHNCVANVKDWYPTRLVECLPNDLFRVVRSDSSLFKPGRGYFTLSHRWGACDFTRLTTQNLAALEDGMPVTILRKIFQEALIVAQRMEIPYVWIDSLCIIQEGDDFADWRRESVTMAEVYCNSLCNISADWGDEDNGLFFERKPAHLKPYGLNLRLKPPEQGDDIWSELRTPTGRIPSYVLYRGSLVEDVLESPLNRRGWVVQERLLAPRVLHFSPMQVSWECHLKLSTEILPLNFISSPTIHLLFDLPCNGHRRERMRRLKLQEPRDAVHWPHIVAQYTACGLTKEEDKLVAIAGIAKRLCPVVKDHYVAGMWAKSLPTSLLWHRSAPKENRSAPEQYFAPTFSWAAADGEVDLVYDNEFSESRIIASAVFTRHRSKSLHCASIRGTRESPDDENLTENIFGPLAAPEAEVRMRGKLRSCSRVPPLPDPHSQPVCTSACPATGVDDPGIQLCLGNGTVMDVYDDRAAREGDARPDSIIYYYTIVECSIRFPASDELSAQNSYNHATGLLLRSVDESMGRFERVGRVEYFRARGAADILQPLGNERDLPAWSYDETTGEHAFYIV